MTTFAHNCMFFGRTETEIEPPEECDPECIVDIFTMGQCHSFAIAAQDLLGGTIYGIDHEEDEDGGMTPGHFVLELADGDYFDARGRRDLMDYDPEPWTREEIASQSDERPGVGVYFGLQVDDARPYVRWVAEQEGLLTEGSPA